MIRRDFIKVMAAGSFFALTPAIYGGCTSSATAQQRKPLDSRENDLRLQLISYAMLAPNSHNIQPWLIELLEENRFNLYVDQSRLLPYTDPPARQIHISQGTFLECLRIAASGVGYRAEIDYFPQGIYSNMTIENKPVASVRLIPDASLQPDPLFPLLQVRQSNKRVYNNQVIPGRILKELQELPSGTGISTKYSTDSELNAELADLLGQAMAVETAGAKRNKETVDIFRFDEAEAEQKRDGFTVANNGITGIMRYMAETFFLGGRQEAYATDSSFAKEGIKLTYNQAKSAAGYGWIVTATNSRLDQVKSGELYSRINLLTAKLGLSQHPLSQILEEYDDMRNLQKKFLTLLQIPSGSTVQMLFRLGYAEPVPHTKRRFPKDLVA